jgi:hypothetical protein
MEEAPTEGDPDAYAVACRLKDFGVPEDEAPVLMQTYWDPRCNPPRTDNTVDPARNAYRYGIDPPGIADPAADFEPIVAGELVADGPAADAKLHPYDEINRDHALVRIGSNYAVLHETTDEAGAYQLDLLTTAAFRTEFAPKTIMIGKKDMPIADEWLKWHGRRTYDKLVFMPGRTAPARFFNVYRGLAVEPLAKGEKPSRDAQAGLDAFLDHALTNVCGGNQALFRWLVGFFADMVQFPGRKPRVALALHGLKGTGKNVLVERIVRLFGKHGIVVDDERYVTGQFNDHLQACIVLVLDEAFWAGDKKSEGKLKGLITGKKIRIEPKGLATYEVDNLLRLILLGNDDRIVPASFEERRFAVFEVGAGRKGDQKFFGRMIECIDEKGGDRLLLRYLLDYDLTGIDVNTAPDTEALHQQKLEGLSVFDEWWLSCLDEGRLAASDFAEEWAEEVDCERFRQAFRRFARETNTRGKLPGDIEIGKRLMKALDVKAPVRDRKRGATTSVYKLPSLAECRAKWEKRIGHKRAEWAAD